MSPVEPRTLKGFRDILPAEMLARDRVIDAVRTTYEKYGFVPLGTPALEAKETLLGYGEEANKQIYLFKDRDGADVGLRYDLTVPLCRVIAQYPELPLPVKRYQVQPVWRFDKPDPGRYREFIQFDIDTVGSTGMAADAEIIAAMCDSLSSLSLDFRLRISNRKILNGMLDFAGIARDMGASVMRVLDKLDKQGLDAVLLELGPGRVDASGDKIRGLELPGEAISKIEQFLSLNRAARAETIAAARELLSGIEDAEAGLSELDEISGYLDSLGVSDGRACIDLSIARGLEYYTGPVFEAVLVDAPEFGSVAAGGRYDTLIEKFIGKSIPATGVSIGVDRLVAAMAALGMAAARPSTADVLVTVMDKSRLSDYFAIAGKLRAEGIRTEVYMGDEKGIGKQLKYADRQVIPVAVIIGTDEFAAGTASIKDLRITRKEPAATADIKNRDEWLKARKGQSTVPLGGLAGELRSILAERE
ncbi:MAG: histidine--tRNA ligase [bacterium]